MATATRFPARRPDERAAIAEKRQRSAVIAAAAAVLILLVWALWPSPYSKVRNLDSRGSNIVAFGDSLTAGYGAQPGEDYPSQLASMIGRPVVNAGVSGDTTASALARVDDLVSQSPRVVLVGLGGNDFLQSVPVATTEANMRTIVTRIQGSGAMVVLLGFRFPSITSSYEKMYERVAKDNGCLLVADLLDGILSNSKLKSDEIHPNGAGYRIMAERLAGPLGKLLKKADARR